MKRIIVAAVSLAAALCMVFSFALAAPRYPVRQDTVTDSAAVFSQATADALKDVLKDVQKQTGSTICIVTVDFLDGYTTAAYLSGMREAWGLDRNVTLILLAVGEDNFAVSLGADSRLSEAMLLKLLSTHVAPYVSQVDYDSAMASLMPALLTEINKTYGTHITAPAFGMTESGSKAPYQPEWLSGWTFSSAGSEHMDDDSHAHDEDDDEFSLGKIVLALILISWVFGSGKGRRRYGCGCGCSPVARLLAALKIWDFFDKD